MEIGFFSKRVVPGASFAALALPEIDNPFCTDAYLSALQKQGDKCWIVGTHAGDVVEGLAVALLRRGRLSNTLEIPSLPEAAQDQTFWDGVYSLCRQLSVADLTVGTFCSPEFKLPPLRGEISRRERKEYIVKLQEEGWDSSLSSNHKRNIKKAVTAGVTVQRVGGRLDRLAEHVRLMEKSLGRRTARGESVPVGSGDKEEIQSYLEFGAGELYQAVRNDIVLSSILVLRSKSVAYYQSAGTSPDGMSVGASHFLIHETCKILRSDGVRVFNLGGAPEGSSLARFKVGFGAAEVSLEACSCNLGPLWLKKVRTALNMVRSGRNRL